MQHCYCCLNAATVYCWSACLPVTFCEACANGYRAKAQSSHHAASIPAKFPDRDELSHGSLQTRRSGFARLDNAIELTVEDIRECAAALERGCEQMIEKIRKYQSHELGALGTLVKDLRRMRDEACKGLSEPQPGSQPEECRELDELLSSPEVGDSGFLTWTCAPTSLNLETVLGVSYALNLRPLPPHLPAQQDLAHLAAIQAGKKTLAVAAKGVLTVVDLVNRTCTPFSAPGLFAAGGETSLAVCHLDGSFTVLASCSYFTAVRRAVLLTVSGHCTQSSRMLDSRRYYGAVALASVLYVFGGLGSAGKLLASAEQLEMGSEFATNQWRELPPMQEGRRCFTPCVSSHCIYLCGGVGSAAVEVLDTLTLQYQLFKLALPEQSETVSAVSESGVVVVTKSFFVVWDLQSGRTESVREHPAWYAFSGCGSAVVLEEKLFNTALGGVNEIDLATGELSRLPLESH